ncbi:hypothetical protein NHF48_023310 [Sphingomonas sp. H160509]|uniref:hypothetical protein n=1 Tax=Sphingomonas sp. H160509 TaxID=2955313 RepID=UPI0020971057|nr:hypothetical protein [Sphingomonas sp. H160509]MDD1453193.1 hypothetical protein [Sphingomonas sp. H160509]
MIFILMLIAAATALWPPAQADWPVGKKIKLAVVLEPRSNKQGIAEDFDAAVRITSVDKVGLDPAMSFTRGISLQVSTIDGIPVLPVFPPAGSPPTPPITDTTYLTKVGHEKPMLVKLKENPPHDIPWRWAIPRARDRFDIRLAPQACTLRTVHFTLGHN